MIPKSSSGARYGHPLDLLPPEILQVVWSNAPALGISTVAMMFLHTCRPTLCCVSIFLATQTLSWTESPLQWSRLYARLFRCNAHFAIFHYFKLIINLKINYKFEFYTKFEYCTMFEFYTKFEFNSKFELYTKFELWSLSFYHFLIILSFLISWLFKCLQLLSGEWREYFSSRRHRFVSTQWLPLRRHDSSSEQKRRICNRWWHESSEFDTSNFDASHHSLHGQHLTLVLCLLPPGTRRFRVGEGLYNQVCVTTADVDLLQTRAAF